jgi:hypothetical protein
MTSQKGKKVIGYGYLGFSDGHPFPEQSSEIYNCGRIYKVYLSRKFARDAFQDVRKVEIRLVKP